MSADGDCPDAATLLEEAHAGLVEIDAFAHAAREALDEVGGFASDDDRRCFDRLHVLVTHTADEAAERLQWVQEAVTQLHRETGTGRARSRRSR